MMRANLDNMSIEGVIELVKDNPAHAFHLELIGDDVWLIITKPVI